jgi:hypothetical protein
MTTVPATKYAAIYARVSTEAQGRGYSMACFKRLPGRSEQAREP